MYKAKRFIPFFIALTLAACAGPSPRHHDVRLISEADGRFRSGDYEGASQIYQRLAEQSGDKDYFRLLAADAELRGGNDRAAQALLNSIAPQELMEEDRQRYALLRSRLYLNQGRASEAMYLLDGIDYQRLSTPLRMHYHTLRASAYNQMGDMLESARERVYYGQLTNNPEAIQKNNESIYDALTRLPYKVVADLQPNTQGTLGGWMALVLALRTPEANRAQAVRAWRADYPGHPANGAFVESFLKKKSKSVEISPLKPVEPRPAPQPAVTAQPQQPQDQTALQPMQPQAAPSQSDLQTQGTPPLAQPAQPSGGFVGVMLPLTGPYASASQALRTGLTAAWNADNNPGKPELRFVDTQGADVSGLYHKLAGEGAKFVIGPLLKDEVSALGRSGDMTTPVLALNQSPEVSREGLYQFALTPEQEVEQAASLAWFDGRQNALLLAPASALGQRLINHFSAYWKGLGGRIAAIKTYQPGASEYSQVAKQLLAGVGGSGDETGLAKPEFIFLIADPRDGRLLNPFLENQQPGMVPVYSTSGIFNGQPNAPQNQDLAGVTFCDIPWLLNSNDGPLSRQAMQMEAQQTPELYLRLIPMGIDAYQLLPQLSQLKSGIQSRITGASGILSLSPGNRLQRQLYCAQFDDKGLQPRGIAPNLQTGGTPTFR